MQPLIVRFDCYDANAPEHEIWDGYAPATFTFAEGEAMVSIQGKGRAKCHHEWKTLNERHAGCCKYTIEWCGRCGTIKKRSHIGIKIKNKYYKPTYA